MEPPTLEATGAVKFIAQEHICCGMCDKSFMFCGCKGLGYGLNYIYKGLPCPSPNSTRKQLIKRWCCIVSSSRVNTFRADLWYQNEIDKLVNAMKEREAVLKQMMEDFISKILPTDSRKQIYIKCLGQNALGQRPENEQFGLLSTVARNAMSIFLAGDWSCLTMIGCTFLNNAYQSSDPNIYKMDDEHLLTVFQLGVSTVNKIKGDLFNEYGGRLALECDRLPCVTPAIDTVTNRDWFLRFIKTNKANMCHACQKAAQDTTLKKCSRCKKVKYCSKECQVKDWKNHKKHCRKIVKVLQRKKE